MVSLEKYYKLFHLKIGKNRPVPLLPALDDNGKFHAWLPRGNEIIDMKVIDLGEGKYFAKKAERGDDIFFDFFHFLYQRCTLTKVFSLLDYIENDMRNLAASLRKFEIFHESQNEEDAHWLATSELEYVLVVCRGMYDHFQFIAKIIWDSVQLNDAAIRKNSLRDTFSKMVLQGEQIMAADDLVLKYGLTEGLARFYSDEAVFFEKLRRLRDDIVHNGGTPSYIYVTEKGFAVDRGNKSFSLFEEVWTPECFSPNDKLASLKPVVAYIISETLGTMGRFANIIGEQIKFSDEIAPGYLLFLRGKYLHKLAELNSYMKDNVWYPEVQRRQSGKID